MEPVTPIYPAAYDDTTTQMTLVNHRVLTVKYPIDVAMLQLTVEEDCTDLPTPTFLVFGSGEIWYVVAGGLAKNTSNDWVFTLVNHEEQRAVHGSPLQMHVEGEKIYLGMLSAHVVMLKRALQAAQRYRYLLGTEAQRALLTPVAGERYLCTDTQRNYYCFTAGIWTWMNRVRHGDLDGLADDDHTQYTRTPQADAWHDASAGYHIPGGDEHDHTSVGQGAGVKSMRAGLLSARGAPVTANDLYFVTDLEGGVLFIAMDGVNWERIAGIPSGAIMMFTVTCPAGWTRYVALDGSFPMGAATAGAVGGSAMHAHYYTDMVQHYHVMAAKSVSLASGGDHSHTVTTKTGGGGSTLAMGVYAGSDTVTTGEAGTHSHSVSVAARDTGATGVASAQTTAGTHVPPYQEVLFCKKD